MTTRLRIARLLVAGLLVLTACGGGTNGDDAAPTVPEPSTVPETTTSSAFPGRTLTTSSSAPTTTPPPVTEPIDTPATSVWVHLFDDTLKTPAGVETMLDEVAAAGIDAVIAQVARRHDAYFDSGYLPATPDPALAPGFDVLEALVDGAHERGLQLHAWFVVAPGHHHQYDGTTLPPDHVWLRHGPGSADSWMTVDHGGVPSPDYFDVGLDAVHDHVVDIVTDIATRYAVDGVHLDYVRYDGAQWGYHPDSVAAFSSATGRSDVPAPTDADWVAWRTARTATLIERAGAALESSRPGALLSAAVIAGGPGPSASPGGFAGTRAATWMFQDWPSWLDDDLVDFVIAMAYTREQTAEHAGWFRQWVAFAGELAERHPDQVGIGVGVYLNPVDSSLVQMDLVRRATGHVGLYSYQQDSSDAERGALLARCCGS